MDWDAPDGPESEYVIIRGTGVVSTDAAESSALQDVWRREIIDEEDIGVVGVTDS